MSDSQLWMSLYVLAWPVIVAAVLALIAGAFGREWAQARKEGRDLV